MKYAIVTGANGFVGRHVVEELIKQNYFVYAIVRNNHSDNINHLENIKIINCNMNEISLILNDISLKNINDCVFYHLAWEGSGGEKRKDYKIQLNNIRNTLEVAQVAKKLGCNKIVVSGSLTQLMYKDYLLEDYVTPEMISIYPAAKVCSEMMLKCICHDIGINLNWTYITNFYGEDDTTNNFINFLVNSYLKGEVPTLTPADQLADFMHVKDVAKALITIGEKGVSNKSYYVGYGEPKPLKEFITIIRDNINPLLDTGIGKKNFEGRSVNFEKIDYNALKEELEFKPEINFKKGIILVIKNMQKKLSTSNPPQYYKLLKQFKYHLVLNTIIYLEVA